MTNNTPTSTIFGIWSILYYTIILLLILDEDDHYFLHTFFIHDCMSIMLSMILYPGLYLDLMMKGKHKYKDVGMEDAWECSKSTWTGCWLYRQILFVKMLKNTVTIPCCSVTIFLVIPAFELEASKFLVAIETYFPIVSISIIPSFVLNWISVNCHPKTQETSSLLFTPGIVHGLNETSCGNKGNSIWKSIFKFNQKRF